MKIAASSESWASVALGATPSGGARAKEMVMLHSLSDQQFDKRPSCTTGEPTDEALLARIQARDD